MTRVLRLVDELEEPEVPLIKKRKLVKETEAKALAIKGQESFANFLGAQRKKGPKLVVMLVAELEAFLANNLVVVNHLNAAPLDPIGATPASTIPIGLVSLNPLESNIQHILDDID
jgi:hypothetical protein